MNNLELAPKTSNKEESVTLFDFASATIEKLKLLGKERTSETYAATLSSFKQFRGGEDIKLKNIDSEHIQTYESYLKNRGVSLNTISFYMRILRAIYNKAVEQDIVEQQYPFKRVYTGIDKTVKRAINIKQIKKIKDFDLSHKPNLEVVRDVFIFSFYTRGMAFVDMAYLRKKNLSNGILSYRRRKTNQQLHIKWEKCMQDIVDKYNTSDTDYLLPIIKNSTINNRIQYMNRLITFNKSLKIIGKMVGVTTPLTMYVSRHSWASIAKSKNIPTSVISEGMGHDSEKTTQIYLASLDTSIVDKANKIVLELL